MIDHFWLSIPDVSTGAAWISALSLIALVAVPGIRWSSRAVLAAHRAQSKLSLIVDSLQGGLVLQDPTGQIVSANPAAVRILGLSRDEITGRTSADPRWQAIHEDGTPWPGEDHPSMRTLRTGVAEQNVVMGLRRSDADVQWITISTSLVKGEGVAIFFSDITESRNAAAQARELEGRFKLLVDSVEDYAIYLLDPTGNISSWNSGAEHFSGYTAAEVVGTNFDCFYPPEDVQLGKPAGGLSIAASTGRYEDEGWRLRKDGNRIWAHVVIRPILDAKGLLIGYAKVLRDLTERRNAEASLAQSNQLREAIFNAAPFAIVATDRNGLISAANPAFEKLLWYKREEVVGLITPGQLLSNVELQRRAMELSQETGRPIQPGFEALTYKSNYGLVEEREWTCVRKDGSSLPINLAVTALRDRDAQLVGYLGIAYDITQRKRLEELTRHQAQHDYLTGLPNRTLLTDRLDVAIRQARRSRKNVAVMMLDLDHFKNVNDTFGHQVGDKLLVTVADRIRDCVRDSDTVARLGGDEFVVILPDLNDMVAAERVANDIAEAIARPMHIGAHELRIKSSAGISRYPNDGVDIASLLHNADIAMYKAKSARGARVRLVASTH